MLTAGVAVSVELRGLRNSLKRFADRVKAASEYADGVSNAQARRPLDDRKGGKNSEEDRKNRQAL